ncbi:MAG: adenylate/guanylate cyclase domain-containing protein [Candidatus Riflemargulisbacteria bacterium]
MKKSLFICIVISVVVFSLYTVGAFKVFDTYIYDNFQRNIDQGSPAEKSIVVVAIDDFTLNRFAVWPFPRSKYAELVHVLNKGGAKVIAFDINFDSYSGYSYEEDLEFAKEISNAKNVILARDYYMEQNLPVIRDPIKELKNNSTLAMVDPVLDSDSFIRRYKMLAYYKEEAFLYFAVQASMLYENIGINRVRIKDREFILNDIKIPLDNNGTMLINYYSRDKGISVIPFAHVLEPEFLELNPNYFRGKLVLVGSTASYLQDSFPTPVDINMPGVLIHANAIRTILNKEFIQLIPNLYYLFLIMVLVVLVYFKTIKKGSLLGLIISASLFVFLIVAQRFMYHYGVYIESAILAFSLVIGYLIAFFVNFLGIKEERNRVKSIFKQYVSPNIVERFISGEEDLAEHGKERVVSVLFADIVGFTSMCEELPPEKVVAQLNEVLDVLTEEVFKHQGTLDKFMGDALMAVWGSPVEQVEHAELAVECATKMLVAIEKLNEKWLKEGNPSLSVGVSISSGHVIAGNIGAKKHKDYTVIGDVVNIGSRLQPLTREGYSIVIEEKTKELVKDKYTVKKIGDITVKGKKNKVSAWTVDVVN